MSAPLTEYELKQLSPRLSGVTANTVLFGGLNGQAVPAGTAPDVISIQALTGYLFGAIGADNTVPRVDATTGNLQASVVIIDDSNGVHAVSMALLSGAAGTSTSYTLGRTFPDGVLAVAGGVNAVLTGTVAGDIALVASGAGKKLWLGNQSSGIGGLYVDDTGRVTIGSDDSVGEVGTILLKVNSDHVVISASTFGAPGQAYPQLILRNNNKTPSAGPGGSIYWQGWNTSTQLLSAGILNAGLVTATAGAEDSLFDFLGYRNGVASQVLFTIDADQDRICSGLDNVFKLGDTGARWTTGYFSTLVSVFGSGTGLPATSGTAVAAGTKIRLDDASNVVLDLGVDGSGTGAAWIQSINKANQAITQTLLLNPRGGNVNVATKLFTGSLDVAVGVPDATHGMTIGGVPAFKSSSGYLGFYDGGGENVVFESGTAGVDPTNYYSQTTHKFRNQGGGTIYATLGPGLQLGAPTGGDKGAETINARALFINGALIGMQSVSISGVNLNAGVPADNAITIPLPTGFTRYQIQFIVVSHASTSLTTCHAAVFSGAGGTGTTIVADQALAALTATTDATAANSLRLTLLNTTTTFTTGTIYFRLTVAQGGAATADVTVFYMPVP